MKALKYAGIKCVAAILFVLAFVSGAIAQADTMAAQSNQHVDMAYTMRSNGKIYVVVTVLSIIMIGLFLYVVRLDRKISKLEKEN